MAWGNRNTRANGRSAINQRWRIDRSTANFSVPCKINLQAREQHNFLSLYSNRCYAATCFLASTLAQCLLLSASITRTVSAGQHQQRGDNRKVHYESILESIGNTTRCRVVGALWLADCRRRHSPVGSWQPHADARRQSCSHRRRSAVVFAALRLATRHSISHRCRKHTFSAAPSCRDRLRISQAISGGWIASPSFERV